MENKSDLLNLSDLEFKIRVMAFINAFVEQMMMRGWFTEEEFMEIYDKSLAEVKAVSKNMVPGDLSELKDFTNNIIQEGK